VKRLNVKIDDLQAAAPGRDENKRDQ